MKLDKEKYIKLIMYILTKCYNKPQVGKTVLCSMMYFIDFNYFEIYGRYLTKETYVKSKKGIKPDSFKDITHELISKNQLFLRKEDYYHRTIHRYYPLIIPTVSFDEKELKIIDSSIEKLSDYNALNITKYANKDPPLILANFGDIIDYKHVFYRNIYNKYIY
ncbi:MAG: DUF4065 domain-containing protein [Methanobrevibacter sp.]|nr:DUF4065 domain-containing protein [Methanobrevibacter sp.]